jgi:hypothetical protein
MRRDVSMAESAEAIKFRVSIDSMSKILNEVLAANHKYAETFGDKATLALPPARRFAILTCMDARLDPAKFAGSREGDAPRDS